jgi:hypothetical protein
MRPDPAAVPAGKAVARAVVRAALGAALLAAAGATAGADGIPPVWDGNGGEAEPRRTRVLPPPTTRPFWQLDLWTRDGAFKDDEDAASEFLSDLVAIGYDSSYGSFEASGALGLRAGVMRSWPAAGVEWGGSLGYVWGPSEKVSLTGNSASSGDGRVDSETTTGFVRMLLEGLKRFPIGRRAEVRLRAGAGLASGRIEAEDRYSGSFVSVLGFPTTASASDSWVGFTWEVMPSLVLPLGDLNVELGIGLAGFPTMKETADFNEFRWTPTGLRLGLEF